MWASAYWPKMSQFGKITLQRKERKRFVSSSILLGSLNGNLMISRKVRKRKAEQNLLFYANNFLL